MRSFAPLLACLTACATSSPPVSQHPEDPAAAAWLKSMHDQLRGRWRSRLTTTFVLIDPTGCKFLLEDRSVGFTLRVDREGVVRDAVLVRSSGVEALDKITLDTVRTSLPFRPGPPISMLRP